MHDEKKSLRICSDLRLGGRFERHGKRRCGFGDHFHQQSREFELLTTPLWYGFHAGSFDMFDGGQPASPSLEALAEDGIVGGLQGNFAAADPAGQQGVLTAPGGFSGAPVIEPGEAASFTFDRALPNRFLSFASMVVPSNAPPNA